MSDKSDSSESKQVLVTHGAYAGQRLTMPAGDADSAVRDGWAVDPFAAPLSDEERAKRPLETDEERAKRAEAADKAGRKLRGEDEDASRPGRAKSADEGGAAGEGSGTTKAKR